MNAARDPWPYRRGDAYPCPRCAKPHPVEQPYRDDTTAAKNYLYVTCRGQQYFVGLERER